MNRILNLRYKSKLVPSVLALVLLVGVLLITPTEAVVADGGWDYCYTGCVNWNKQQGCIGCLACCANTNGAYTCWNEELAFCA